MITPTFFVDSMSVIVISTSNNNYLKGNLFVYIKFYTFSI